METENELANAQELVFEVENIPEFYINFMACRSGRYDVELIFGTHFGGAKAKSLVKVKMSLEHLKSMVLPIQHIINKYEDTFGPIPQKPSEAECPQKGEEG